MPVQWVENSTPLYELYTGWQAQRAERSALAAAVAQRQAQAHPAVQRPAAGQQQTRRTGLLPGAQARQARAQQNKTAPPAPLSPKSLAAKQQQVLQARPVDQFYARIKVRMSARALHQVAWGDTAGFSARGAHCHALPIHPAGSRH